MDVIKAVDGKKFNTGNIIAWISASALLLNLSPEQTETMKEIVTESEYIYGLIFGAVVAAVGLGDKIRKTVQSFTDKK